MKVKNMNKKEETEIKLEGFDAILKAQQQEYMSQKHLLLAGIEGEAKTGKSGWTRTSRPSIWIAMSEQYLLGKPITTPRIGL